MNVGDGGEGMKSGSGCRGGRCLGCFSIRRIINYNRYLTGFPGNRQLYPSSARGREGVGDSRVGVTENWRNGG